MAKYNEAQKKAVMKYERNNIRRVLIKLNINTDADILEKLSTVMNKQGYIKQLIRKDIAEDQNRSIDSPETKE